jgi:hypothetical protein
MSTRRRTPPPSPRDAAEAQGYDTGSRAIDVVVEDVAVGARQTIKVARRADPLGRVDGCTPGMRAAAALFRRAYEHVDAGRGMGPIDPGREQRHTRGDGLGVTLLQQERAMTAAEWHRRGVQAMGLAASQGVVHWVVVRGGTLADYDEVRRWRRHTARVQLLAALARLADEYGLG